MGANLPAKKYKKTNPTQTRLSFECTGGETQFIDLGLALSVINRKAYRAGVYYYVNSVEVYNNSTGVIDLHTVPDTWVTKNAWNRGLRLFQKMNSMVDSPVSNIGRPKYHDFKVYMSDLHRATGSILPSLHSINNLAATASTGLTPDDWEYSQFVSADDDQDGTAEADNFFVHMLGPHSGNPDNWTSIGLIRSYAQSRQQLKGPEIPNSSLTAPNDGADTDPLVNVFDFSSEEQMNDIVRNLDADNDEPPYDNEKYIGESQKHMQHVARIGTEQGVGRVGRASGFCVPFGLICIDAWGLSSGDDFRVVINLAQGTYHGVYAERA